MLFTFELLVNFASNYWHGFVGEMWNWLDTVVVIISLIAIPLDDIPGVKVLRVLRAFRIVRVFKRLTALRLIVRATALSIVPVANTFIVLLLATAVFAILGQSLFAEKSPRFFGNFMISFFTMFQCVTGDGWASEVVRPMFVEQSSQFDEANTFENARDEFDLQVFIFFFTFCLLITLVIVNIVLAVLLDEFLKAAEMEKMEQYLEQKEQQTALTSRPVSPLEGLMRMLTNYSAEELSQRLQALFRFLDCDRSGSIDYYELQEGLSSLALKPPVHISLEDYQDLTQNFTLCNEEQKLCAPARPPAPRAAPPTAASVQAGRGCVLRPRRAQDVLALRHARARTPADVRAEGGAGRDGGRERQGLGGRHPAIHLQLCDHGAGRDAAHARGGVVQVPVGALLRRARGALRRGRRNLPPLGRQTRDEQGIRRRRGAGRARRRRAGRGAPRAPRGRARAQEPRRAPPPPYCCSYPCPYCTLPLLTTAKPLSGANASRTPMATKSPSSAASPPSSARHARRAPCPRRPPAHLRALRAHGLLGVPARSPPRRPRGGTCCGWCV